MLISASSDLHEAAKPLRDDFMLIIGVDKTRKICTFSPGLSINQISKPYL
jgi:hypothetical protein